jgi:hypothetical protein
LPFKEPEKMGKIPKIFTKFTGFISRLYFNYRDIHAPLMPANTPAKDHRVIYWLEVAIQISRFVLYPSFLYSQP